jgi:hypothetical protein
MSRPELRTGFRHSHLLDYVMRNRGKLVGALLVMVRAWYSADCPAPRTPILGSFEEWARVVGGILETCGVTDFLGNAEAARARACDDEDGWEAYLEALMDHFEREPFTAKDVAYLVNEHIKPVCDAFPDWLEPDPKKKQDGFVRRIGNAFARQEDKCYGVTDIRVTRTGNRKANKQHWTIKTHDNTLDQVSLLDVTNLDDPQFERESDPRLVRVSSEDPTPCEKNQDVHDNTHDAFSH